MKAQEIESFANRLELAIEGMNDLDAAFAETALQNLIDLAKGLRDSE